MNNIINFNATDMTKWKEFLKEKGYCKYIDGKPECDVNKDSNCFICLDKNIFDKYKEFLKNT